MHRLRAQGHAGQGYVDWNFVVVAAKNWIFMNRYGSLSITQHKP